MRKRAFSRNLSAIILWLILCIFAFYNAVSMKKLLRFIRRTFFYMLLIIATMLFAFYLMAPVYDFSGPGSFSGSKLYNPYKNMEPTQWKRYNFQVQSRAWLGLTSGRGNSNELIDSVYTALGFDYVATSDYQKINLHGKNKPSFIPTYEHGYNFFKTHQVCIDARKVLWTDLAIWQSKSMKQWIIDQLKEDCGIVALAHPALRKGYKLKDMQFLCRYDLLEVLCGTHISANHWDVALSSGQLAWILADDDTHDIRNLKELGRSFTMINSPTTNKKDVLAALSSGNSYGVNYYNSIDTTLKEKADQIKKLPYLVSAELKGDTFSVTFSRHMLHIEFIGENGQIRKKISNKRSASYIIQPDDPYIRVKANFYYVCDYYLNPVVRYEGEAPQSVKTAVIDVKATLRNRIIYFMALLTLAFLYAKRKQKKTSK